MRALLVIALSALAACTANGVIIPDGDNPSGVDPEPEPDPDPASPYAGDWSSELALWVDFGRGPDQLCAGKTLLVVDDEGAFADEVMCTIEFGGGPGNQSFYAVQIEGEFDEDGLLTANSSWERSSDWMSELADTPLEGQADDNAVTGAGVVLVDLGFQQLDGEVVLELRR